MPTVAASEHVVPSLLENDAVVLGVLFDSNPLPMAMFYADTMEFFAMNDAWRRLRREGGSNEVKVQRWRPLVHHGRPAHLARSFDVSELNRVTASLKANSILLETADDVTGIETYSLDLRTG